jgi:hypothetical protein
MSIRHGQPKMEMCAECNRLGWPENNQPRYGLNGRILCWTHAQLEISSSPNQKEEHDRLQTTIRGDGREQGETRAEAGAKKVESPKG